jgi:hypothetical protein
VGRFGGRLRLKEGGGIGGPEVEGGVGAGGGVMFGIYGGVDVECIAIPEFTSPEFISPEPLALGSFRANIGFD